jgi:tetratricopeptide (TPR) repeat protein
MDKKCNPRFVYLLIIVVFLGTSNLWCQEDHALAEYKNAKSVFRDGEYLFLTGDYKKAEKELLKCLKALPQHADSYFLLAQIEYKNGNLDKSREYIISAKKKYVFFKGIEHLYVKELREEQQRIISDLSGLKSELDQTRDRSAQPSLRNRIMWTEREISIIDDQMKQFVPEAEQEEVIPADYHYVHGNVLFKNKNYKEALDEYNEAVKIDPAHGSAYNNLANLYYMSKEYKKALDCLTRAEQKGVEINPELKQAVLKALGK